MCQVILFAVAVSFFSFWSVNWFLMHFSAIFYGIWKLFRKRRLTAATRNWPGVSILKPLVGADPNLESNLETFFAMNYPIYEILFCMHEDGDPSLEIVERLRKKYPEVRSRVFVGGERVGANMKINNLFPGYREAKYDLFFFSDAGVKVKADTLMDMVQHMTDRVGLVHQLPLVCDGEGFTNALEKVYFSTVCARIYLAAAMHGFNCHIGMSALMRRSVLSEIGGLEKFSNHLAEDYVLASAVLSKGYKLVISSQPVWQNLESKRLSVFLARIARWTQIRFATQPHQVFVEPLFECLVNGLLGAWAARELFGWDPIPFYVLHVLVWLILDVILTIVVNGGVMPMNVFHFLACWIFRECSVLYPYLYAVFVPAIQWRAGIYRLDWGGQVKEAGLAPPSIR
ncbi:unnamed protein product [Darwinula stevensoni]|uniref:ceramide glucosyltransferase n=1 Tax=Darwinula stevensoni TaxID=69355 RepID=A0A7R9A5E7_9CRUS|nr:unnamed protein product [Darwinula stevensoni]CAG0886315.1 unnamed protein product [Darwinula stevensoni]